MTTDHIKIPDIAPIVRYVANGSQTDFAYPFPIFASEDLSITINDVVQSAGFSVSGSGETGGGTVSFDTAPTEDSVLIIRRDVPLERMTDFIESGDFSAKALNSELDYLMAGMQQVARAQDSMLRFPDHELEAQGQLPDKDMRAGRALAFDEKGDPIIIPHGQTVEDPAFIPAGEGAVTRSLSDKARESVSPQDFGALGDGVSDDSQAFIKAIQAAKNILVPVGQYRITQSINIPSGIVFQGQGEATRIIADTRDFPVFTMHGEGAMLLTLSIEDAGTAVQIGGGASHCCLNLVQAVTIKNPETGISVIEPADTTKDCDANHIDYVRIISPSVQGVVIGRNNVAGQIPADTAITNLDVRSNGQAMSGCGVEITDAEGQTILEKSIIDVDGTAISCVRLGAGASKVCLRDIKTHSGDSTPNVSLLAGSLGTVIINLNAGSDGVVIDDQSGGAFQALMTGQDDRMDRINVGVLTRGVDIYNSVSVSSSTVLTGDIGKVFVSGLTSDITLTLPAASDAAFAVFRLTRTDTTNYAVTITAASGDGPNGGDVLLGNDGSHMEIFSDGTDWVILSQSRMIGRTFSYAGGGTFNLDTAADLYLLSPDTSGLTVVLPSAAAIGMRGRSLTIKNENGNSLSVTESGATGPDGAVFALDAQDDAVSVMSNGSQWLVVSDYSQSSGGGAAGVVLRTQMLTSSGTVQADSNYDFFNIDNSAGYMRLELPDPTLAAMEGRMMWFRKNDTSGNTVDFYDVNGNRPDNAGYNMNGKNEAFSFCCQGGVWRLASVYLY